MDIKHQLEQLRLGRLTRCEEVLLAGEALAMIERYERLIRDQAKINMSLMDEQGSSLEIAGVE